MSKINTETKTESTETKVESTPTLHQQMVGMNKSQKIRFLAGLGYEKAEISRILYLRYQFVRNVLNSPLKSQS